MSLPFSSLRNGSLLWVKTAERIGPQMKFNGSLALTMILALAIGLVLRLFTKRKRRDSESTSRMNDGYGEEIHALRKELDSTSRSDIVSREEYEVFLCFRGSDTRNGFTDCLYHGLRGAGIHVFLDSEELEDGDEISKVLKAVS